jgi:predicted Zn-ribbon and HTH transcriptional regulator
MDNKQANPLSKHFRRPAIYLKLPSNGQFWPEGSLDMPITNEIPIYPMTTNDEITLKTPDALMNGSAIVNVIQSCCPSILNAWQMPSVDVDAVLIAVRIASYGEGMAISSKCASCGEEHDYDINLSELVARSQCPDYSETVNYDNLKIKLKPQEYVNITKANLVQYEEEKIARALRDKNVSEDVRNAEMAKSLKAIIDLNNNLMTSSTEYIEIEDGTRVTNPDHISDFYRNAESKVTKLIEEKLNDIARNGSMPPIDLKCTDCGFEYKTPLEFDYSRFFGIGS